MEAFSKLVNLLETLRGEKGCPWDRKQTVKEFKTYLLEEVYELIEAIDKDDAAALQEELGDLLFHIVFISQICRERGLFDIESVISATYEKMYRRHPHVFGGTGSGTPIEKKWEELKREETRITRPSPMCEADACAPSGVRHIETGVEDGIDWEKLDHIHEKLAEEIGEMKAAQESGQIDACGRR